MLDWVHPVTLAELRSKLATRREDYARLRAHVDAAVLLGEVLELLERVDGTETAPGRDLTTRETAALLGLANHRTVEQYCRAGRLPGAYKTSGETGDWRVPAAAIEAFRSRAGARNLVRA